MKTITLSWGDEDYKIRENEAFAIGEEIEDIITFNELVAMQRKGAPKLRKLSRCYSAMINFAGGHVTPQEVHTAMMDQIKGEKDEDVSIIVGITSALLELLMDGMPEPGSEDAGEPKKT